MMPKAWERAGSTTAARVRCRDMTRADSELSMRLFAVASPGLEPVVAAELQALAGARQVTPLPGGVEFTGDLATLYRANVGLRSASRVLLRVAQVRALHFASLRRQV